MHYDERKREWHLNYEPKSCANLCYSQNGYCPILGKELSKKRGNVYYDLKKSEIRHDGTIFDGEEMVTIEKGIRYFDKPASMDICEAFVKVQSDEILQNYIWNNSTDCIFNKDLKVEVVNIRAEQKESRDLMQDLQDIKNGIVITHASDNNKRKQEEKRERRQKAKEKRMAAMEKRLISVGYENMEPYEQNKACKLLGFERLDELEVIREENRQRKLKEEQEKPKQVSIFDLMSDVS